MVYFAADAFVDGLKEVCDLRGWSPFVTALLVLGVDPEESVASIVAAAGGFGHLAVGNVVGNTVIALTVTFGLPALLYGLDLGRSPSAYPAFLVALAALVVAGCYVPLGLATFGAVNLGLFVAYLAYARRHFTDAGGGNESQGGESAPLETSEGGPPPAVKVVVGLPLIVLGGFGIVASVEGFVEVLGIAEEFFGFVVVAFATNAEELTLIVAAVRHGRPEIGVGAEVGKVAWNLGFTFGISGVILGDVNPTATYGLNLGLLLAVTGYLAFLVARRGKATKGDGTVLLALLVLFTLHNVNETFLLS